MHFSFCLTVKLHKYDNKSLFKQPFVVRHDELTLDMFGSPKSRRHAAFTATGKRGRPVNVLLLHRWRCDATGRDLHLRSLLFCFIVLLNFLN